MTRALRYLALGDSYTIGEAVARAESFPHQLVARLRAEEFDLAAPNIIARTGWTTDDLHAALDAHPPQGIYDLVTLLIGVNNQYRGRDLENYRLEFAALLERALAYTGNAPTRVIVLSIPDWGVTPFARGRTNVSEAIDAYNAINRAETRAYGAHYVEITNASRRAQHDAALLARDGLHPSAKMYAEWAQALVPIVREIANASCA